VFRRDLDVRLVVRTDRRSTGRLGEQRERREQRQVETLFEDEHGLHATVGDEEIASLLRESPR
jgi:hypothetical protein